ncbi:MAG: hypothetical protein J0L56_01695 [Chitinophagales bacterium]|nr:hypothetical protein [Chitinophagales bacterium]
MHGCHRDHYRFNTACTAWICAGGAHHTCYSRNISSEGLEDFAEMTGIGYILICKTAIIPNLKRELRVNDVVYKFNE